MLRGIYSYFEEFGEYSCSFSGYLPEMNLRGDKKKNKKNKIKVEIAPLMSFKHLRMINSASKCLNNYT
jgi:hypothetical protein